MSLQLAAQHLAHHGRGDDKMLVHMTPKEVSGLQQLAQMHGGSLTVNPHTGLPEAGFLDSLLPTIIGGAAMILSDGAIQPWMIGLGVGGVEAARTGNLGKGLMAGLGAYGGAGLAGGLAGAGESELARQSLGSQFSEVLPENATQTQVADFTKQVDAARAAAIDQAKNASIVDKLGEGLSDVGNNPLDFAKNNWKSGLMAAAPIVADQMVQTTTPPPSKSAIHPFRYDPGGGYTRLNAVSPAENFKGFADGGMAQSNAGGGMFNYAQMQPAVDLHPNSGVSPQNMADGGVAHFDDGGYTSYTPEQIQSYFAANPTANVAAATQEFHADPAAVAAAGYVPAGLAAIDRSLGASNPAQGGQIAIQNAQNNAAALGQGLTGANAAQQVLNPYNSFTNDQYATFFNDPKNASVLNTPGGLAAAEKQYNADPTAAMTYLQNNADKLNLSGSDLYQIGQGQGIQGVYDAADKWVAAHPNATGAEIAQVLKDAQFSNNDVQNYFNRANSAYGTNLATGKAFTGAQDINTIIGNKQGFSDLSNNINNWIKDHPPTTTSLKDAQDAMSLYGVNELDLKRATGKTSAEIYAAAKKISGTDLGTNTGTGGTNTGPATTTQTVLPTNPQTNAPAGTTNPYGNKNNPGDITKNADGTITVQPNIPGRPYGGFSGMNEVTNAYTAGGGHTGPTNLYVPKSVEELNAKYPTSGGSQQMLDYLSGKTTENPMLHPYTPTGQVSKDYATSVLGYPEQDTSQKMYLFDAAAKKMIRNPDYIPINYDTTTGSKVYGKSLNQIRTDFSKNANMSDADWLKYITDNNIQPQQIADATNVSLGEVLQHIQTAKANAKNSGVGNATQQSTGDAAGGGIMHAAMGGAMYSSGGIGDLGSYSDGGRLLRGPGDGVSDSIPATIGQGKPARLADGEFVVPARIVSELGNGSTEAGARKLYTMMDRVQNTRGKTIGKGKVATNTRADKFLPA